ncbi:MAG: YnbE family lipoprotein [Candidatus Omnitrophica bacterium]|nr:YnbE family lipoprotein [Candidatus Omnitrophota bacterium]
MIKILKSETQISQTPRFGHLSLGHSNLFQISCFGFQVYLLFILLWTGCTVKAVGDPNRPITINANVVIDIRGLKQTASSIEDMVAKGGKS